MDYKILSTIKSPKDIKQLNKNELVLLSQEIRNCLIETVSNNGGHLASNLGAVELTIALHRVFNSPEDSIIFDVGHQSYTHKLLTGRFKDFSTLRKEDGISGFMNPDESEHDAVISGHSSTSVSAAYGIYKAKSLSGEQGVAVAVIGDGAMTGGMAFEAFNNIGEDKSKFIVVLNDNKMSISKNVGALAGHLGKIRSKSGYHSFKFKLSRFLNAIPGIGPLLYRGLLKSKNLLKVAIYHNNIFEGLGFDYLGPVDGHDISAVENILNIAKMQNSPALVHVVTVKGKGYSFAESDPGTYHGVSNFNIEKGFSARKNKSYSDIAGEALCSLADIDNKICAITAAMTDGTGLTEFSEKFSDRFFDVGIAEEHAMTFSAGLAKGGLKPYFVVYSSFLQRSYDQIIHDVALSGLPVRILVDRAGFVGEDGKTHQGLFDVSFLSSVPGVTVYSPASYSELTATIMSTKDADSPIVIRYPRGTQPEEDLFGFSGKDFDVFNNNGTVAAVSYGRLSYNVFSAVNKSENVDFIKLNKIFPLSDEIISILKNYKKVYIFEEGIRAGSIGEKIISALHISGYTGTANLTAVDSEFVSAASVQSQMDKYGLSEQSILNSIKE